MREIKISEIKQSEKLIYYIKEKYPNVSTSVLHKALRNKDIKVNGTRITDQNYALRNGDILQIYIDDMLLFGFPKDLDIIFEDKNILVVFKPQGLLSNNEGKKISEPTFEEFVKAKKGDNVNICHRLDRNTSGLLIFTKTQEAYEDMLVGFRDGFVSKEYIAYVAGSKFKKDHQILERYLLKDEKNGFAKIYDTQVKGSQKIVTEFFVKKSFSKEDYAVLRVLIHTGKTHQIRAQMSNISHPLIGDSKYGKNDINKKFKKYKQMLYAVKYTFTFPKDSVLNYLNKLTVELDSSYYDVKL